MAALPRTSKAEQRYLIALGSNQRHHGHGAPQQVLCAALARLQDHKITVELASRIISSDPLGPSRRRYANAAALIRFAGDPPSLLARLKHIEQAFGRRCGGQRWAARVLDIDVILWGGGAWVSPGLTVPHPAFRERPFVLGPARKIAPGWCDPITVLTLAHLNARLRRSLTRPRPLPRDRAR